MNYIAATEIISIFAAVNPQVVVPLHHHHWDSEDYHFRDRYFLKIIKTNKSTIVLNDFNYTIAFRKAERAQKVALLFFIDLTQPR